MLPSLIPSCLVLTLGSYQPPDLAEGMLRSGERAYAAKSYAEAMETWSQLLKQAPGTPQAAEALLRMARHTYLVEHKADVALQYVDQLRSEYLKQSAAPEGLLLRARILSDQARRPQDAREAAAEYHRFLDLFPGHLSTPMAHLGLARLLGREGKAVAALDQAMEALRWDPQGPAAAEAMLMVADGLDAQGDAAGCLSLLQQVRERGKDQPEGQDAVDRLNLRIRHRMLKPALKSHGLWPEGRKDWLKTPTLMVKPWQGDLFLYQDDLNQAFRLQDGTLVAAGPTVKDAKAMAVLADGRVALAARSGLYVEGASAPVNLGDVGQPSGLVPDAWGGFWVSDSRKGQLLHVQADGTVQAVPSPSLAALAALPCGGMVGASDSNRTLVFLDGAGQPKGTVPYGKDLPVPFKAVLALATDACGHVAALVDGDFEGIVLWGPDGRLLRHATFKALGLSGRFRSLVLDRSGSLFVADRSADLILRLD